jgi:hypothetical protein
VAVRNQEEIKHWSLVISHRLRRYSKAEKRIHSPSALAIFHLRNSLDYNDDKNALRRRRVKQEVRSNTLSASYSLDSDHQPKQIPVPSSGMLTPNFA